MHSGASGTHAGVGSPMSVNLFQIDITFWDIKFETFIMSIIIITRWRFNGDDWPRSKIPDFRVLTIYDSRTKHIVLGSYSFFQIFSCRRYLYSYTEHRYRTRLLVLKVEEILFRIYFQVVFYTKVISTD